MTRILILVLTGWALWWDAAPSYAETCLSQSSVPTFQAGQAVPQVCDTHGTQKVMTVDQDGNYVSGGGGGGGDASAANQVTTHGYIDGLEGLITSTNTKLDTLDGRVDGLEALVTSTNSKLDTAITALQLIDDDQTGTSNKHFVTAGLTEDETEVKATAGRLIAVQASNSAATVAYLRCANLTAANTTPGTSTVFWGMAIPGATTGAGVAAQIGGPSGLAFSTALTCWVVGGKAETDVAEVGANDVQVNLQYK